MQKEKNTWLVGLLDIISITIEPFLRKDFGERYFTILKFLLSSLIFLLFFGSAVSLSFLQADYYSKSRFDFFSGRNVANTDLSNGYSLLAWFYVLLILTYFLLGFWEMRNNFNRNKSGQRWHTYNSGTSRFEIFQTIADKQGITDLLGQNLITPFVSQIYLEPLTLFIFSIIVSLFTALTSVLTLGFLAFWLFYGSIFLFIKGQIMYGRLKNQVLNARDSQIEADFMEKVVSGELTLPNQTDGLTAISLRPQTSDSVVQTTQDAIKRAMEKNPRIGKRKEEIFVELVK